MIHKTISFGASLPINSDLCECLLSLPFDLLSASRAFLASHFSTKKAFSFIPKMDPPVATRITQILRNGKNFPNLLVVENDREFILRRKSSLAKSLKYICSGSTEKKNPCKRTYNVTVSDKICKKGRYTRERKQPNGKISKFNENKLTIVKNDEFFNIENYTINSVSGDHICTGADIVEQQMWTFVKQELDNLLKE